jgi:Putative adhesin
MKKLIAAIAIVFTSQFVFAQKDGEKPFMVKNFASSEIKNLNVKTSGGGITVEGGYESNSVVEVYIRANNWNDKLDKAEIEDRLKDYDLIVTQNGNTIECVANNKSQNMNWKRGLSITFKIFSPKNVSTELNTSGGGINMKNLKGNLNFKTSGGGLSLAGLSGKVMGKTSGGGISMTDCNDVVDLVTSGGGITAKNSTGSILLRTSGGGLDLENLKGKINATTSGGGIDADHISGELITSTSGGSIDLDDVSGNIKASTSGGGIRANISSIDDFLTLSASSGSINVDMPMSKGMDLDVDGQRVSYNGLKNFDGEVDKDRIYGKLNGGGAKVKIHAGSGNVNINK